MNYQDVPAAMVKLAEKSGFGAIALRFAILTAARSQEVRGALWSEIDFEGKLWNVSPERMKMRRPHKVPLSEQALAALAEAAEIRRMGCELVFPSARDGWLSDMTLSKAMRDLKLEGVPHGMRATFGSWVDECTTVPEPVRETCLAHAISDKVMQAYRRSDFLDARRNLMNAWGRYCAGDDRGNGSENVIQLDAHRG